MRLALITGAAGDIGRATGLVLAEAGWRVALTDQPAAADDLARTAEQCAAGGADVWSETADVTDDASAADLVRSCGDSFGTPTGLFANAGLQGRFDRSTVTPSTSCAARSTSTSSACSPCSRRQRGRWSRHGTGRQRRHTASMAGVSGAPNMSAYSATKAAVIGLAKSAAKDLAPPASG